MLLKSFMKTLSLVGTLAFADIHQEAINAFNVDPDVVKLRTNVAKSEAISNATATIIQKSNYGQPFDGLQSTTFLVTQTFKGKDEKTKILGALVSVAVFEGKSTYAVSIVDLQSVGGRPDFHLGRLIAGEEKPAVN